MKKQNISILFLIPMMLTSCNNNSSPVALPNKGTEITAEEGKAKFKQSYDASVASDNSSSDAFQFSFSNVSFTLDADVSAKDGETSSTVAKFSFKLTDLSATFAIKGLTSNNADDIKGYMGLEFSLEYNYEVDASLISMASGTLSGKLEKKKYEINAYFDKSALYLDLSNENVLALLKSINKNYVTSPFNSGNGKYYIDSPFANSQLPLVKSSDVDVESYTKFESSFINMESEGTFKSHGNDTYSYSYSLDGSKINSEFEKLKNADIDTSGNQSLNIGLSLMKNVSIDSSSKLEYAAIFNTNKGITSIGYNEDMKLNYGDTSSNISGTITSTSSAKLSFDYGSGVTVKEVGDKSGYKKYTSLV